MSFLDKAKAKLTDAVDQHGDKIAQGIDKKPGVELIATSRRVETFVTNGAPTPLKADTIVKADAPTQPKAAPVTNEPKTTEAPSQTGAGEPHAGNKGGDKPAASDVIPTKGQGQNQ